MPVLTGPLVATHSLPNAQFTSLATPTRGSRETSVWRVRLEAGGAPVPHSVTREEIFVVLSGTVRVQWEDSAQNAKPGDVILVPPQVRFALACANDQPAEMLCCLPVGGQACLPDGVAFTPPWAQ